MSDPTLREWMRASDEVKRALCGYTGDMYGDINKMCDNPDLSNILQRRFIPTAARQMQNIEGFISTTSLEQDMLFRRSTTFDEIQGVFGKDMVSKIKLNKEGVIGAKGVNKRFSSMSFTKTSNFGESYRNDVEIIYFAPKGTQATYARGFSEVQGVGQAWMGEVGEAFDLEQENEFILNRNYAMRISKVEKRGDITRLFIDILLRNKR